MVDRDRVKEAFVDYTSSYDVSDTRISLKIDHTFKVAEIAEEIARSIDLNEDGVELVWLAGMLHDFGRFEQIHLYGTFYDKDSTDHAQLGADLLFKQNEIDRFVDGDELVEGLSRNALLETMIRQHNKYRLPESLDEVTRKYCTILRDADKADIFRVLVEVPFEERNGKKEWPARHKARHEVMEYVKRHSCVPRVHERSIFETLVSHGCMAFELEFPKTIEIVKEQGKLKELLSGDGWNDEEKAQLAFLEKEIESEWTARG